VYAVNFYISVLCVDIERLKSALMVADDIMATAATCLSKVLQFVHFYGQFVKSVVWVWVCTFVAVTKCQMQCSVSPLCYYHYHFTAIIQDNLWPATPV